MDSTGENWRIQVPWYTAELLQEKGYTCVVNNHFFFVLVKNQLFNSQKNKNCKNLAFFFSIA